jgi:hypothetical protein
MTCERPPTAITGQHNCWRFAAAGDIPIAGHGTYVAGLAELMFYVGPGNRCAQHACKQLTPPLKQLSRHSFCPDSSSLAARVRNSVRVSSNRGLPDSAFAARVKGSNHTV